MKTLHSLTQQLDRLRRTTQPIRSLLSFGEVEASVDTNTSELQAQKRAILSQRQHSATRRSQRSDRQRCPSSMMWVVAVVSLTSVGGNRFYNQPGLNVSTIAPQTIRAPQDARVEDTKTTEEKRKAARTGFVPVLMIDRTYTDQIYQNLQQSLDEADQVRSVAGAFPFVAPAVLSTSSQQYLRSSEDWEWQAVMNAVKISPDKASPSPDLLVPNQTNSETERSLDLAFFQTVTELKTYRAANSAIAFNDLISLISQSRQRYAQAVQQLKAPRAEKANSRYEVTLLELSDTDWEQTQDGIHQAATRMLTQGIPRGLPKSILKEAVRLQVGMVIPTGTESLATQLLTEVLQPNLVEDKEQTKQRAEQAAQAVPPQLVTIKQGEVIVESGKAISQADFVLLDHFGLSRRQTNWLGLAGFGCFVTGAVGVFVLVERRFSMALRRRDYILILLLSLSTPLIAAFNFPYSSLPAVGLLIGSFYGSPLGLTVVGLLTVVAGTGLEVAWESLLAGAAGGLLGAFMAGKTRSREELALLGGAVGLTQGAVNLIVNLILSSAAGMIWYAVLPEAAIYGLSGLAWSIVALGISPYLERFFDLVTPIRLAELANPNRSLLKRLATEAPGTFQHTLFVATLAEAAARELHCNVELVRTGTLYHDIGKMHDPLGFIENQMGGPNKHNEINDPWKSAEIIKKHVTEGLVMARKYQLPKAVRDFIPEHQGKLLISYFYYQAQQLVEKEGETQPVQESDFRYDGPIPQSRETAVVMLADACEAALRSLKDATPETALATILKIFKARWQDNQLIDSGLTREDLSIIAEVFVRVWQQSNHQRIPYPKAALNPQPLVGN
jgi:putative nucleotidyltransferase with HDIG domain